MKKFYSTPFELIELVRCPKHPTYKVMRKTDGRL